MIQTDPVSATANPGSVTERVLTDTVGNMGVLDLLTGVYHQRYLEETLPVAIRECRQHGQKLSILYVDIDRFEAINDRYGRLVGDLVLQHVAQTLKRRARLPESWVSREEADAFVICLPGVSASAAKRCANNLRVAIMSERLHLESGEINLTCSFGVQTMEETNTKLTADALLREAKGKAALAKQAGGNAVV